MPLLGLLDAAVAAEGPCSSPIPGRRHATAFFEAARSDGLVWSRLERGEFPGAIRAPRQPEASTSRLRAEPRLSPARV